MDAATCSHPRLCGFCRGVFGIALKAHRFYRYRSHSPDSDVLDFYDDIDQLGLFVLPYSSLLYDLYYESIVLEGNGNPIRTDM